MKIYRLGTCRATWKDKNQKNESIMIRILNIIRLIYGIGRIN